jgi:hypothetical protein
MVAWLRRDLRSDTVTIGGVEQATPAQLTVMMLSLPAASRVLTRSTGRGKTQGFGDIFFFMIGPRERGDKRTSPNDEKPSSDGTLSDWFSASELPPGIGRGREFFASFGKQP